MADQVVPIAPLLQGPTTVLPAPLTRMFAIGLPLIVITESLLQRTARSARDAPVRLRDRFARMLGAEVRQTPSRARSATSQFAPTPRVFSVATRSASRTRQCCHSFCVVQRLPWT